MGKMFFLIIISFRIIHAQKSQRIVGGEISEILPYQVSLHNNEGGLFCGGALISSEYVLTAAHCIYAGCEPDNQRHIGQTLIRAGYTRIENPEESMQERKIIRIFKLEGPHAFCSNSDVSKGDIVLLQLDASFNLTDEVKPATLPDGSALDLNRTLVTISGWGLLYYLGEPADVLQKVNIRLEPCDRNGSQAGVDLSTEKLSSDVFCAGTYNYSNPDANPQDACQGDSGGPLVRSHSIELLGLVSYGYGCHGNGKYVDVYQYVPSIIKMMTRPPDEENFLEKSRRNWKLSLMMVALVVAFISAVGFFWLRIRQKRGLAQRSKEENVRQAKMQEEMNRRRQNISNRRKQDRSGRKERSGKGGNDRPNKGGKTDHTNKGGKTDRRKKGGKTAGDYGKGSYDIVQ